MIGRQFGRLTVLEDTGKRKRGNIIWTCLCICGNKPDVTGIQLKLGKTKSCGCLRKEMSRKRFLIHSDSGTRLYKIWIHMKSRCYLKTDPNYKDYGARGIKVCPSWLHSYPPFKAWALRNGYQDNLTIDKKENDGNYSPKNCQWLTKSENSKKRWRNRKALNWKI